MASRALEHGTLCAVLTMANLDAYVRFADMTKGTPVLHRARDGHAGSRAAGAASCLHPYPAPLAGTRIASSAVANQVE